jgi:hypothetical protein
VDFDVTDRVTLTFASKQPWRFGLLTAVAMV